MSPKDLPPELYDDILQTLRYTLPRPPIDTPEAREDRDNRALACVASLEPADRIEADFAIQSVVLAEHARDCLRVAQDPSLSIEMSLKHHAQALP